MTQATEPDVVIVGGGIAGSVLALQLARQGRSVTVLEQQRAYADRVRGEYMALWGVAIAQRLGVFDALVAAGAAQPRWSVTYDETIPPPAAEGGKLDHLGLVPGVGGVLCLHHPVACETLNRLAAEAGAHVLRGVDQVSVQPGTSPRVAYRVDNQTASASPRLVVGADGRTSTVRQQAGIPLNRAAETNVMVGLLVDGAAEWPQDTYALGTEGDRMYFVFPQGDQRLRLYMCLAPADRDRFAGPDGATRMLQSFDMACLPYSATITAAQPIGPCATWSGEDTWTDTPFVDGVVLIGDAAGYNGPIIGQGLSLALRDVEVVSGLLLESADWSPEALRPYAAERAERMRRVRFSASLVSDLFCAFGPDGARRRGAFFARNASHADPTLDWVFAPVLVGPDQLPEQAFDEAFRENVLSGIAAGA